MFPLLLWSQVIGVVEPPVEPPPVVPSPFNEGSGGGGGGLLIRRPQRKRRSVPADAAISGVTAHAYTGRVSAEGFGAARTVGQLASVSSAAVSARGVHNLPPDELVMLLFEVDL
jgi:hypothetical protein